jgi:hypothetical protein
MDPFFATTGDPPRIQRVEAFAFHDAAGRIRHMHHSIVLEGAEERPSQAIIDEVRAQALALGNDLSTFKVLHVTTPFNFATQHKVDVKKRMLVELRPPTRSLQARADARRKKR